MIYALKNPYPFTEMYIGFLLVITQFLVFFKSKTNNLDCQLLTNKIKIIKLFGLLGGRKDGFKL